ncbi:KAP family P-loop NTPase fold protein [Acinetobacter sp. WCHAc060025]|uniref:KAP family P-loop NTPase fold protein n=1 Tax=Acinetobacter sp. WCHAc060025 TaxID=2518625 RepID=UPI0010235375|nr:P-loop NTPase fold protein [Acinetobacter sp. WCHAc060025]RZG72307.1 P-loop ATPase [Acinetobacter sp. WCHAc060025]
MSELNQLPWQRTNLENIEQAWDGDLWDRERLGIQLTNYVDRLNCGAVLALDARWGEGKTWFVRNWKRHLENKNHHVIYLDAFANDYLEDPFLTIAAEISEAFKTAENIDESEVESFNEKTASVLISLAAILPVIATKAALHWVGLGGAGEAIQEVYKDGKDVYDSLSDEITGKLKEHIEKKIENHHLEKQTIVDFKNELKELASKLEKPLVFIIDELDRCRPDFAIRLIERIKHFFDIPKIVFVLVMNKPQLLQSIKSFYGYDSESNGDYLEKFVDFTIKFPEIINSKIYQHIIKEQLFRINELKSTETVNQLYYLVLGLQLLKKFNSRELSKKINQFALLRTDDNKMNMILMALLFDQSVSTNLFNFKQIVDVLFTYLGGGILVI